MVMGTKTKRIITVLLAAILVAGGTAWLLKHKNGQTTLFRTAPVVRSPFEVTLTATGTLVPEEVIDVGAQVAGKITEFGIDANGKTVDYGSFVKEGMVLARIDDALYAADLSQAKAQVESAKAGLERAKADLEQMKAKLVQAERDWKRAQRLGPSEALSQASYDAYQSAYETAKANVAVGKAAILQAQATLAQAQAAMQRAQQNLDYCTIRSPVTGVVIDRRVNIGQTVVASLNAPSLFLIAKDLTRMQVWVPVNEADIGKIHPGMPVTFTVDAFPGEAFRGMVGKIRLNASMTQNVVTYTVEIITDNPGGRLLPYLTANVRFEIDRIPEALLVPNSALRWTPIAEQVAPELRKDLSSYSANKGKSGDGKSPPVGALPSTKDGAEWGILWVPDGKYVKPRRVQIRLKDDTMAAIEGEGITPGLKVVTGVQKKTDSRDATNPFTPQFTRPSSGGGSR